MTPEPDYPAAHSMDTEWYAVDRDGHVALFDSGEAGAMPELAHTNNETSWDDLAKILPEAPYRLRDWLDDDGDEQHEELPDRRSEQGMGPTLLFLANLDLIAEQLENFEVEQAPAAEGVAVLFRDLPVELAWRIHEAGACFGCFPWPEEFKGGDLTRDLLRRMGLFRYDHETDNWIAGGYARGRPPIHPLQIEQLPPEISEAINRVRFEDVRFAEAEKIQPVDHTPCVAWGEAYLDLDGRTIRPIPGREDEFNAEDFAWNPNVRVVTPGQDPPGGSPPPDSTNRET